MRGLLRFTLSFILVYMIVSIMIAGQAFFIPFLIALIISYFIIALAEWVKKIFRLPMPLAYIAAFSGILVFFYIVSTIVTNNVQSLIELAPVYQKKLEEVMNAVSDRFHFSKPNYQDLFGEFNFGSILGSIALMIRDVARNAGVITLYVIFMIIEYYYFHDKMKAFFKTQKSLESAEQIASKIARKTQSYLRLKTLMSLVTAVLSYVLMIAVGVDFAEFWALLIFFLNYIPTIGSIAATAFPCLLTILQFQSFWPFAIISVGLISTQFIIGNIVEPRVMGKQFNLSGLVILVSLTISGTIWGITGMFLCVPILMITSIILNSFPKTRPIAILLSQTGDLEN